MNCKSGQKHLYAYADGQLDERTAEVMRRHVEACAACAYLVEEHKVMRAALRRELEQITIPTALRGRVRAAVAADKPDDVAAAAPRRAIFTLRRVALAACIALAAGLTWYYGFSTDPTMAIIAQRHRTCCKEGLDHQALALPPDAAGAAQAISKRYDILALAPELSAHGYAFESANFCGVQWANCTTGGHLVYLKDDGGKRSRFSVFSVPPWEPLERLCKTSRASEAIQPVIVPPTEGGPDVCVALWHKDRTYYICCGEMKRDEMLAIAEDVRVALRNKSAEQMLVALARGGIER